jgi:hypothetical protein
VGAFSPVAWVGWPGAEVDQRHRFFKKLFEVNYLQNFQIHPLVILWSNSLLKTITYLGTRGFFHILAKEE